MHAIQRVFVDSYVIGIGYSMSVWWQLRNVIDIIYMLIQEVYRDGIREHSNIATFSHA